MSEGKIKSQLLYRLSYGLKSLIPQGILRGFRHSSKCQNRTGTYVYGKQRVPSISPSLNSMPAVRLGPLGESDYFDESDWRHRLDTDNHAPISPDSNIGLYALLAVMAIGLVMLFGASAYVLLG